MLLLFLLLLRLLKCYFDWSSLVEQGGSVVIVSSKFARVLKSIFMFMFSWRQVLLPLLPLLPRLPLLLLQQNVRNLRTSGQSPNKNNADDNSNNNNNNNSNWQTTARRANNAICAMRLSSNVGVSVESQTESELESVSELELKLESQSVAELLPPPWGSG